MAQPWVGKHRRQNYRKRRIFGENSFGSYASTGSAVSFIEQRPSLCSG